MQGQTIYLGMIVVKTFFYKGR